MGRACLPFLPADRLGPLVLGLLLALGCKPQIGDKCTTSTDCSQVGDRLCDISQPSGYCTIFNCEPKGSNAAASCPDGASCVAFGADPSPVAGCENALGSTPYTRTFCMKECDNGNDCREGYVCEDPEADERFSAVDVDGRTKVCMVAFSAAAPGTKGDTSSSDVCTATSLPPDAFPEPPASGNGGAPDGSGDGELGAAGAGTPGAGGIDGI
jgi:hypothetical protein